MTMIHNDPLRDPRPTPRDRAVLEAHAQLEAAGRFPSVLAVAQATGLHRCSVQAARQRLAATGFLVTSPGAMGGGRAYRVAPGALVEARSVVPKLPRAAVPDHDIAAAAASLVAEGVYPSCVAVAELAGCSQGTVGRRIKRLESLGLWPDWRAAGLKPSDANAARLRRDNFRRRKRVEEAAGLKPRGDRTYRERTVYRHARTP